MADVPKDIMEALTSYVLRYGGMCRDCADENGTCPTSGMPCDPDVCRPVIRRTIKALAYGIEHGFIASPFLSERERRTSPGWPDPLQSPQAEAIRSGKIDDVEIRNLFDQMEREIQVHRKTFCERRTAQGVTGKRPYPQLLSDEEKKAILTDAENLWLDLQENKLGGYSGVNRPFYILFSLKLAIEKYGNRDIGLTWSKDALDAAAPSLSTSAGGGE